MKMILLAAAVLALTTAASARTRKTTTTTTTVTEPAPSHHHYSSSEPFFSGDGTNEIQVGTAGNGALTTTPVGDSHTQTNLDLRGNYMYLLEPHWQVGGEFQFFSVSRDGFSDSGISLMGEGAYNFDEDLRASFYAKGGVGLMQQTKDDGTGKSEGKFSLFVGAGKRVPLMTSVLWAPEFRMYKIGSAGVTFELMVINVSLLF